MTEAELVWAGNDTVFTKAIGALLNQPIPEDATLKLWRLDGVQSVTIEYTGHLVRIDTHEQGSMELRRALLDDDGNQIDASRPFTFPPIGALRVGVAVMGLVDRVKTVVTHDEKDPH